MIFVGLWFVGNKSKKQKNQVKSKGCPPVLFIRGANLGRVQQTSESTSNFNLRTLITWTRVMRLLYVLFAMQNYGKMKSIEVINLERTHIFPCFVVKAKIFVASIRCFHLLRWVEKLTLPLTNAMFRILSELAVKIIIVWAVLYLHMDPNQSSLNFTYMILKTKFRIDIMLSVLCISPSHSLDIEIRQFLKVMLDSTNELIKWYRMARYYFSENPHMDLKLRLIGRRQKDGRTYNLPVSLYIISPLAYGSFSL
uniref:Uncharacterized protein n=1 Tax=Lactuca sativa TaxID=4236 RepID=A0A9R1WJG0_LACSA|nr:hypothetical protein LSAT_V11C100027120 [Lactuca sativa]